MTGSGASVHPGAPSASARLVRVLGIDPGSRATGYGVVEVQGGVLTVVDSGCIRTPDGSLAERLGCIHEGVLRVVREYGPDVLAIEQVFMARNPQSALKLGQARGAAIAAAAHEGVPMFEYAPRQMKKTIVGVGGASKAQVQHMVGVLLRCDAQALGEDEADALALAVCHVHSHPIDALAARPGALSRPS